MSSDQRDWSMGTNANGSSAGRGLVDHSDAGAFADSDALAMADAHIVLVAMHHIALYVLVAPSEIAASGVDIT